MPKQATTDDATPASAAKPLPATPTAQLAAFLINANKIGDSLQDAIAGDADVTITDWLLLHVLDSEGPLLAAKAATRVGITRQRVHQQIAPLKKAGLIDLVDTDGKHKALAIAPEGAALVKRLDDKFLSLLSADPALAPAAMLHAAHGSTRRMVKVLSQQKARKAA